MLKMGGLLGQPDMNKVHICFEDKCPDLSTNSDFGIFSVQMTVMEKTVVVF